MVELKNYFISAEGKIYWKSLFYVALGAWVAYAVLVWLLFDSLTDAGLFGDMFGGINALFSGLALIGVVVAIFYQRQELKLQRKELELTREEMRCQRKEMAGQKDQLEGQKQILDKQHETATIQQFENAFYQLLQTHINLNKSMYKYRQDNYYQPEVVGNALFEVFFHKSNDDNFDTANEDYNEQIIPYLYRVELILDLIHNSDMHNKGLYVNVFRGSCTSCEMKVIDLYLKNRQGFASLQKLMDEYGFAYLLNYEVP